MFQAQGGVTIALTSGPFGFKGPTQTQTVRDEILQAAGCQDQVKSEELQLHTPPGSGSFQPCWRLEEPATLKEQLSQRPLEGRGCHQCWSPGAFPTLPVLHPEPRIPAAAGEGKPATCSLPLPSAPPCPLTPLGVMLSHILEAGFTVLQSTFLSFSQHQSPPVKPESWECTHFIGKRN